MGESLIRRFFLWPFYLMAFIIPFPNHVVAVFATLFVSIWALSELYFKFHERILQRWKIFVLGGLIIFYLLHIIGISYSDNVTAALFDAEVKLTLLLFPLVFFFSSSRIKKHTNEILFFFLLGSVIVSLYLILMAFYNSIYWIPSSGIHFNPYVPVPHIDANTAPENFFRYFRLSGFKHPTYLSEYLIFGIIIAVDFLKHKKLPFVNTFKKHHTYGLIFICLLFASMVFMMSSRTNMMILFIIIIGLAGWLGNISKKKIAVVSIIVLLLAVLNVQYNSRFYYSKKVLSNIGRVKELAQEKKYNSIFNEFGSYRIPILLASSNIVKNNFLLGVGTGDVREELSRQYEKNGMVLFKASSLNAHNQFLETLLGLGIIGLSTLLILLILPFVIAFRKKDLLWFLFLVTFTLNLISESMLNTISGVIFFSFFYCLLIIRSEENNQSCLHS